MHTFNKIMVYVMITENYISKTHGQHFLPFQFDNYEIVKRLTKSNEVVT